MTLCEDGLGPLDFSNRHQTLGKASPIKRKKLFCQRQGIVTQGNDLVLQCQLAQGRLKLQNQLLCVQQISQFSLLKLIAGTVNRYLIGDLTNVAQQRLIQFKNKGTTITRVKGAGCIITAEPLGQQAG